eukprot:492216_1
MQSLYLRTLLMYLLIIVGNANQCSDITCSNDSLCTPNDYPDSSQCHYINCCCKDTISRGHINYLTLTYCTINNGNTFISIMILSILLIYLFLLMNMIITQYFAKLMEQLAECFNLSPTVSGVTFHAWANGAADVASSIAAISHGGEQIKLGIAALLGAAVFDTQFIGATIVYLCGDNGNIQIAKKPFLRDSIYLHLTTFVLLMVCWNGIMEIYEPILMLIIYICYVILICIVNKRRTYHQHGTTDGELTENNQNEKMRISYSELISSKRSKFIDDMNTNSMLLTCILKIISFPIFLISLLFKITITLPDNKHWNNKLSIIHCITVPILFTFVFYIFNTRFYWIISIIIGMILVIITFIYIQKKRLKYNRWLMQNEDLENIDEYGTIAVTELSSVVTSVNDTQSNDSKGITLVGIHETNDTLKQPVLKNLFLILSFIACISWIYLFAQEIVNILTVFGIIASIDLTIFGLTILALGNSIPDFIHNITIARNGYASVAIASGLGGTAMNINLGLGIGALIGNASNTNKWSYPIPNSQKIFVGCLFVMFGCVAWNIIVVFNKWMLNKVFAIFGYMHYTLFMLVNILFYLNVIDINMNNNR